MDIAVGRWWKAQVTDNQNVHGYSPREFNFGFLGELKMDITLPDGKVIRYIAQNIMVGQSSPSFEQRWWLADKTCIQGAKPSTISCTGKDSITGKTAIVLFRLASYGLIVSRSSFLSIIEAKLV